MKLIAFISPVNPAPCIGNEKLRIIQTARCLKAGGFTVSLIICDTKFSGPPPEELFRVFDKVKVLPPPARRSFLRLLAGMFIGSPVPRYPDLAANIAAVIKDWKPAAVHVINTFLSAQVSLKSLRREGFLAVLDGGGVHHLVYQEKAFAADDPSKYWLWRKRTVKLKQYETRLLSRFNAVTATNKENVELLKEMDPSANIVFVPEGRAENTPDALSSESADKPAWPDCTRDLVDFYRKHLM
jgi:hypothetical protein